MAEIPDHYILFVSDLFLYHGGVSDYTDHLAQQLQRKNRLNYVVTPFPVPADRDYSIRRFAFNPERKPGNFDRWRIGSKVNTLFYYFRLYRDAYRGMKKLKLQKGNECLVFTEYYTFQFDIIIFIARILNIRYAIVFHGLDLICAKKQGFKHFRKNFEAADFIIYNSQATRLLALDLFHSAHRHSGILYPGIDMKLLDKYLNHKTGENHFEKNKDEIVFSTVSRLVKRKGIDLAIRMVSVLQETFPRLRYYIAGTGVEEGRLKELVKQLRAEEYIIFLGDISNEKKYALLNNTDIFLFPNHSDGQNDFEGFGISCIEASFFGNLVIAGRHGGVKEAVLDGETGFLFDFDKPGAMDQAVGVIRGMIEDPAQQEKIRKRGMEYVRSTYDWNKLIDHFLNAEQTFFAA